MKWKVKNEYFATWLSKTIIVAPEEARNPIPWRLPTSKKAWRTELTMRPATRSAEQVGMPKYAATVAVKSLIVTEWEEGREIMWRKKGIAIIVLRYGLVLMPGGSIVRIVSSHPTAVSWYSLKKNTELTTLVWAIYADRLLLAVLFIAMVVMVNWWRTAMSSGTYCNTILQYIAKLLQYILQYINYFAIYCRNFLVQYMIYCNIRQYIVI